MIEGKIFFNSKKIRGAKKIYFLQAHDLINILLQLESGTDINIQPN
jgi:hypothetical protein